jgi:hypothetical protein
MIDIQQKKQNIINFLKNSGPSLPVQIAKAIQMDPVFASAILSELLSSKQIITSHMRIGSSPLYLLPNQLQKLETKTEHLKPIEKETQEKLKEKGILYDEKEEPATRVALRNIKDFAKPSKQNEKIVWKYAFDTTKEEKKEPKPEEQEEPEKKPEAPKTREEETKKTKEHQKPVENIFDKKEESEKKTTKSETFLEEIEIFLEKKQIKIISLEKVDKKEVIAKISSPNETSMLFAFNRLRITEPELLKCYKEAKKKNLPYQIITKGDLTKKLQETIEAYQKLQAHYKLEN